MLYISIKTPHYSVFQLLKKNCNTVTVQSYMYDDTVAGLYNFFITLFSLPLSLSLLLPLCLSRVITLSSLPLSHLSHFSKVYELK